MTDLSPAALQPLPTVKAHMITPCENCPYRLDAPRRHWAKAEFHGVLAGETETLGRLYCCHKHAVLPEASRGLCAGWLLDQKRRGMPSIKLRMALAHDPSTFAAFEAVHDGGHALFKTVKAMCRANGVRPRKESRCQSSL